MKTYSVRRAALGLLRRAEEGGAFVNLLLSDRVLGEAGAEADRLTALVYGTTERRLTLDYLIGALSGRGEGDIHPETRQLLRPALYELLYLSSPAHAVVNEWVALARSPGERGFVNAILRTADRRREALPLPPEGKTARYLSVKESFPLGTVKRFLLLFGAEETAALLSAFNRVLPTTLCLSPETDRDACLAALSAGGFSVEPTAISPRGIRLLSGSPTALPGFAEGQFFVQDEASMLAAEALCADTPAPRAEDVVIDVCACPGGKTFGAAFLRGRVGRYYAFDLHESKLSLIERGAERLGLSVSVGAQDATVGREELFGRAELVICDVPCSGLGVLGKKADLRYREPTGDLPPLQQQILETSFRYLKAGGCLLYSTCTLLPEENEEQVRAFLSSHPEAALAPFSLGDGRLDSADGMMTLLPHRHGTDGFFFAKIRKCKQ